MSWEDYLTEDEKIALQWMKSDREAARQELLAAKLKFDRVCDEIYLLSRTVRERNDL